MTTFRTRIPLLPKLISGLKTMCKILDLAQPVVRPFVPEGNRAAYDTACQAIRDACDVIRAIDFMDINADTNPTWGDRTS